MKSQLESLRAKQGNTSQQQRHLVWQRHTWEIRAHTCPARIPLQLFLLYFQCLVFSGLCGIRDIWGRNGCTANLATERQRLCLFWIQVVDEVYDSCASRHATQKGILWVPRYMNGRQIREDMEGMSLLVCLDSLRCVVSLQRDHNPLFHHISRLSFFRIRIIYSILPLFGMDRKHGGRTRNYPW